MGTTIAGNQHAGSVYKEMQYVWAPGIGSDNQVVELFEEDGFFVYQFNPVYDQREDGILAVEFYYYYHKPDTQAFWTYVYDPDLYYIVPFIAWYYDEGNIGNFGAIMSEAPKISLVGRNSGWIHVTLHVEEAIYGQYISSKGKLCQNPVYFGIYSPLLNFCYDTSVVNGGPIVPYHLEFDYGDEEDYDVYDFLIEGYMEDFYWRRNKKNIYPSFYITYRDVTPESLAYSVNEVSVMNVTSSITKKAIFKKLLAEIKSACSVPERKVLVKRIGGSDTVSTNDTLFFQKIFKRLFSENLIPASNNGRKQDHNLSLSSIINTDSVQGRRMLLFRHTASSSEVVDSNSKNAVWKRLLDTVPNVESDVIRKQKLFRSAESESDFKATPFASRLFFRTVHSAMNFWDWIRGKIREANNVVTLFCPVDLEVEIKCKL